MEKPGNSASHAWRKSGAFIIACPSLGASALWVAVESDSYREDYRTFLNVEYGLRLESIPKPFDVDHLYNQARAANARDDEVNAYATFAGAKLGLDPKEVRRSVMYLREKASTPWARRAQA